MLKSLSCLSWTRALHVTRHFWKNLSHHEVSLPTTQSLNRCPGGHLNHKILHVCLRISCVTRCVLFVCPLSVWVPHRDSRQHVHHTHAHIPRGPTVCWVVRHVDIYYKIPCGSKLLELAAGSHTLGDKLTHTQTNTLPTAKKVQKIKHLQTHSLRVVHWK